jgi:hypothetical protein
MALSRHNDDVTNPLWPKRTRRHALDLVVAYEGKTCVFMGIPSPLFLYNVIALCHSCGYSRVKESTVL